MRPYVQLAATLLLAAVVGVAWADDVDDFVTEMKRIEKTWEVKEPRSKEMQEIDEIGQKRFPDRVYRSFAGVFNHVNFKKLGDKTWNVPGLPYDTKPHFDQRGPQIRGWWSNGEDGAPEDQVSCVVVSFAHSESVPFPSLEREVESTDPRELLKAYYEVSMAGLAPVPEPAEGEDPKSPSEERKLALADAKDCAAPKGKKVGRMCDFFAATQGLVTAKGERERREWYAWSDKSREATYVLFVRFHASALDDSKALQKGASFAKAISDGS